MAERNGKYYAVDETDWGSFPVYTTPPQRKPLTDEEVLSVVHSIDPSHQYLPSALRQLARAIEAAHGIKEKNT